MRKPADALKDPRPASPVKKYRVVAVRCASGYRWAVVRTDMTGEQTLQWRWRNAVKLAIELNLIAHYYGDYYTSDVVSHGGRNAD